MNSSAKIVPLPPEVLAFCEKAAKEWQIDLHSRADLKRLSDHVLRLSDFFIASPENSTPWSEIWAQQAYVFYFLPMNSLRLVRIHEHIARFLPALGTEQFIDFGAGLATAARVFKQIKAQKILIEQSSEAQRLTTAFDSSPSDYQWQNKAPTLQQVQGKKTLACFSYSLTELRELPHWAKEVEALLVIEPSTQQDGRKLMQLREELIAKGYQILAPCTHQETCPQLHQSKNDWCHDRVHIQPTEWMTKIEENLPMKNRTLTMSYLFAVQKSSLAQVQINKESKILARITGDLLKEKGKDRQLFCRGPQREYFAWMHKHGEHPEIPRGALIEVPENLKLVANECRVGPETGPFRIEEN